MDLDPVLLSRLQFAWVIGWHILLPAFTIGMASYITILEGMHLVTGRSVYLRISMYWIRIFSVAFGVGVVTGVIMPFQIGTNWSRYADTTGNVLGPLFAYEALTAFFLEAAFLGVLLFGRKLVPPWAHFAAALMIASGTLFSSFWILAANSCNTIGTRRTSTIGRLPTPLTTRIGMRPINKSTMTTGPMPSWTGTRRTNTIGGRSMPPTTRHGI
jgi:cytochrome bd ubiquinol oxidase subunit I